MREVKMYRCDYCGALFESEEEARVCERSHIHTSRVEGSQYRPQEIYPYILLVKMNDDKLLRFKRVESEEDLNDRR